MIISGNDREIDNTTNIILDMVDQATQEYELKPPDMTYNQLK
jgi:hypothetical protein